MTTYPAPMVPAASGIRVTTGIRRQSGTRSRPETRVPAPQALRTMPYALVPPPMTSLAQMTSTGEIIAAKMRAVPWARKSVRTARLPCACPIPARRRTSQPSRGVGVGGRERAARRQRDGHRGEDRGAEPQGGGSAPKPATMRPPSAGPTAKQTEKETLSSVLPASSWPSGLSVAATAARVSARPDEGQDPVHRREGEDEREPRSRREQRQRREDRRPRRDRARAARGGRRHGRVGRSPRARRAPVRAGCTATAPSSRGRCACGRRRADRARRSRSPNRAR